MAEQAGRAFVLSVESSNGFVSEMMTGIADAFSFHGWQTEVLDVSGMQPFARTLDRLLEETAKQPALIVDYLGHHRLHTMRALAHNQFFIFLSDAPYAYFDAVLSFGSNCQVGYSDEAHATFFDDQAVRFRRAFFPHAGPGVVAGTKPFKDRSIQFLVLANLTRSPHPEALGHVLANPTARTIVEQLIARVIDGNEEPYVAFKHACAGGNIDPSALGTAADRARFVARLAEWIEAKRRHDILVALKDRPVHIAGNIAPDFFRQPMPNLVKLGMKTTRDCVALMGEAKIAVNSIAVRPSGAHERIWYGLAMGAVPWTDPSTVLARDFAGGGILSLPRTATDIRRMASEIANGAGLERQVEAAREIYSAKHTWRARVGHLLAQYAFDPIGG